MAGLATRLSERSHDVTLITLDDASGDKHSVSDAVRRVPLDVMRPSRHPLQGILKNLQRRNRLRRAIRAAEPDVILSFCDRTNVLTLMASASLGIPVVVSERSDPRFHPIGRGWNWLRRRYYPRAASLVALTAASAEAMQDWHPKPAAVIPSAIDISQTVSDRTPNARATDEEAGGRKVVLGVGRLAWEKGFDRLIAAFAKVASRHPDWDLRIVGEGPMRDSLQRQISASGLQKRAALLGWQQDVDACYRQADLFVLSSRYEGFPSALLEAMAAGLPCVAVDCESGPREIIQSDNDGVLVPAEPATALSDELDRLMNDRKFRMRLGRSASQTVQRFGWNAMVDGYERLLAEAAAFSSAALGRK